MKSLDELIDKFILKYTVYTCTNDSVEFMKEHILKDLNEIKEFLDEKGE